MNAPRSSLLMTSFIGKTIKCVSDIPSDLHAGNDDTNGFTIEFTDGAKVTVSAMSDQSVGVVGVLLGEPLEVRVLASGRRMEEAYQELLQYAYSAGCNTVQLRDTQSVAEGDDAQREFAEKYGDSPSMMAEYRRGVREEKFRRHLSI